MFEFNKLQNDQKKSKKVYNQIIDIKFNDMFFIK